MSIGKNEIEGQETEGGAQKSVIEEPKREARYDRCFSGLEIKIGKGPLKDMDPDKLKREIKRWASAVAKFARQISFGSPRASSQSEKERESVHAQK